MNECPHIHVEYLGVRFFGDRLWVLEIRCRDCGSLSGTALPEIPKLERK